MLLAYSTRRSITNPIAMLSAKASDSQTSSKSLLPALPNSGLTTFGKGPAALKERLLDADPDLVCFNGMTAYRNYLKYAKQVVERLSNGLQQRRIGDIEVFIAPSPSAANATYSIEELTGYSHQVVGRLVYLRVRSAAS